MIEEKSQIKIQEKAGLYFNQGFHCAEAVVRAFFENEDQGLLPAVKYATAFGGGLGRSHREMCGAVSGAAIVIGHFSGRMEPFEKWDEPALMAATLRDRFIEKYKTTQCGILRERFGEMQPQCCTKIVEDTARILAQILEKRSDSISAPN